MVPLRAAEPFTALKDHDPILCPTVTERHFTLPARPSPRTRGGRMRARPVVAALAAAAAFVAGCGSGGSGVSKDPVTQISTGGGLQAKVRAALTPSADHFPATGGKTLQALANEIGGGSQMGLAELGLRRRAREPARLRRDRPQRRLPLRAYRRVRRTHARKPRQGAVSGARRRARDGRPVPLQAGRHGAGSVRRDLRRAGPVPAGRASTP